MKPTFFIILQLVCCYAFIVSGLIVNFLQLLTLIFIWPFNKHLYRRINYYLAYSFLSSNYYLPNINFFIEIIFK
jgi:hypothetical protein